jgi:hypothetical protein
MVLNDSRGEGNAAAATEQQALAAPPPPLADVVAAGPFHGHPPVAMHGAAFSPAPVHGWGPWLAPPAGMMAPVPQPMAIQGMSVAPAGFVPAVHPQFHPRLAWPGVPYGHQRLPPHPHQQPIAGPLPTPPVQQGYPGLQELPRDPWGVADSGGAAFSHRCPLQHAGSVQACCNVPVMLCRGERSTGAAQRREQQLRRRC